MSDSDESESTRKACPDVCRDDDLPPYNYSYNTTVDFWKRIGRSGKEHNLNMQQKFCRVIHGFTPSFADMFGIMRPEKAFLKAFGVKQILSILLLLRICLNAYTVFEGVKLGLEISLNPQNEGDRPTEFSFLNETTNATWTDSKIQICLLDFQWANATDTEQDYCFFHTLLRRKSSRVIAYFEATVVLVTFLLVTLFIIKFKCYSKKRKEDNLSERAMLIYKKPFILMVFPKVLAQFSAISPLIFINVGLTIKFYYFEYYRLYLHVLESSAPNRFRALYTKDYDGGVLQYHTKHKRAIGVFCFLLTLMLIAIAVQALLIKMTQMYFVTFASIEEWGFHSKVIFLGFVNQIAGIFDTDVFELHRLLRLKFAGEEETLLDIQDFSDFVGFLMAKFVDDDGHGVCKCLVAFTNFNAESLHELVHDQPDREVVKQTDVERAEAIKELLDPSMEECDELQKMDTMNSFVTRDLGRLLAEAVIGPNIQDIPSEDKIATMKDWVERDLKGVLKGMATGTQSSDANERNVKERKLLRILQVNAMISKLSTKKKKNTRSAKPEASTDNASPSGALQTRVLSSPVHAIPACVTSRPSTGVQLVPVQTIVEASPLRTPLAVRPVVTHVAPTYTARPTYSPLLQTNSSRRSL